MNKWIKNSKDLNQHYNQIISRGLVTIVIYFSVGVLWIMYSDWLVESLISDITTLNRVQSFKGISFVMLTTVFMFILLNRYNNIVMTFKEAYEDSQIKCNELSLDNKKNALYQILTRYITGDYQTSKALAIDVFRYLFDKVDACDHGSVFTVGEEFVTYIDVIGYDKNNLNNIKLPSDNIELYTYGINKNSRPEKSLMSKLGPDKYKMYSEMNPAIHESIYLGLIDEDKIKFGMSFDISESKYKATRATYSESAIKEIKEAQMLMTSMFSIKNMLSLKSLVQADIVSSFIAALEYHDEYTKGHSIEVAKLADGMGKVLRLSDDDLEELHWASLIHDLGKIVIPNEVLNKEGRLTDAEYTLVKEHSVNGESFLNKSESLRDIAKYIRHHHERYDGKGYPDGLEGEEIPLLARIITVADSYHAMTSNRPYRKAFTHEKALGELVNNERRQFCPKVVEAFLMMYDTIDR